VLPTLDVPWRAVGGRAEPAGHDGGLG